jgi:protein-S-isoprenylcysteine O-methyltransferase Ste14
MRRSQAIVGSVVFFVLAPGTVAGLVPWLLTGWRWRSTPDGWGALVGPLRVLGLLMLVAGAGFLVTAFVRFAGEGRGTPAPVAPPSRLVIGGIYRYVRNPMYLAVLACILGQALLLVQPVLLLDALVSAAAMVAFTKLYEEPALHRRFGADYDRYRANVPGWWPRRHPWSDHPQ